MMNEKHKRLQAQILNDPVLNQAQKGALEYVRELSIGQEQMAMQTLENNMKAMGEPVEKVHKLIKCIFIICLFTILLLIQISRKCSLLYMSRWKFFPLYYGIPTSEISLKPVLPKGSISPALGVFGNTIFLETHIRTY